MLEKLKEQVLEANRSLAAHGLVVGTRGNASGIDRERGLVVIKPTGVDYDKLSPDDLPVVDLDGRVVEGKLPPSIDTATHIEIYRAFPKVGGIAHTHSVYASSFAQAGRGIKPYGTTHADYFPGIIPCTRKMTPTELADEYERNTGLVIAETFAQIDSDRIHAVLVHSNSPFAWGKDVAEAVEYATVLESIAQMAFQTELLQLAIGVKGVPMQQDLLNLHFKRKNRLK